MVGVFSLLLLQLKVPFHRHAANYSLLERCRILCTRGKGEMLIDQEISQVKNASIKINQWMVSLIEQIKVDSYERI